MAKIEIVKTQLTTKEFSDFILSHSNEICMKYEEKLASYDGVVTIILNYPHVSDPDYNGLVSSVAHCKNLISLLASFGNELQHIAIGHNL
jgi:hypothetical protein